MACWARRGVVGGKGCEITGWGTFCSVLTLSYTVKWTSLLNTISSCDQKLYRLKVGTVICHEYTDLDANLCIGHFPLSTSSCGQEIRTSQSWKPNHCACLLNSRIIPFMFFFSFFKGDHPLIQWTLQKSKQSGSGKAAVLLQPYISHKSPPPALLLEFETKPEWKLNKEQLSVV